MDQLHSACQLVKGATGEEFFVTKDINVEEIRKDLAAIRDSGIKSIAVVLAHSYAFSGHEAAIGGIAKDLGIS